MGLTSVVVCTVLPYFITKLPPRFGLVGANLISGLLLILLIFASTCERYWHYAVPSMVLVTAGSTSAYIISKCVPMSLSKCSCKRPDVSSHSVGIISSVPPEKVGVAAAIFSAAQQVGSAVNVAIITTISVQVQAKHPYPSYKGPSSALWFIVALGIAQAIIVAIFFRPR